MRPSAKTRWVGASATIARQATARPPARIGSATGSKGVLSRMKSPAWLCMSTVSAPLKSCSTAVGSALTSSPRKPMANAADPPPRKRRRPIAITARHRRSDQSHRARLAGFVEVEGRLPDSDFAVVHDPNFDPAPGDLSAGCAVFPLAFPIIGDHLAHQRTQLLAQMIALFTLATGAVELF